LKGLQATVFPGSEVRTWVS